ncbi:hypothetical protein DFH09DRAFT_1280242 [Mycena vulgaris]|nr:hypothetical protein DFH09DRAFT_1280242 [Mycena vulgaris]
MEVANVLALASDSKAQELNEAQYKAAATSALCTEELKPTLSLPQVAWKSASAYIHSALMVVATAAMLKVLVDPESSENLGIAEKFVIHGGVTVVRFFVGVASIVGRTIGRTLQFLEGTWLAKGTRRAAVWTANATRKTCNWMKNLTSKWDEIGKCVMKVFGFVVSVAGLVASAFDFDKALAEGQLVDQIFTGVQLVLAAFEIICLTVHDVGCLACSEAVCSACAYFGPVIAAAGVVVALIAIAANWICKDPDPVEQFIDKYGKECKLLVRMRTKKPPSEIKLIAVPSRD